MTNCSEILRNTGTDASVARNERRRVCPCFREISSFTGEVMPHDELSLFYGIFADTLRAMLDSYKSFR